MRSDYTEAFGAKCQTSAHSEVDPIV
jgi:hypothetical protein